MSPIPVTNEPQRLVVYFQTTHTKEGLPISLLGLDKAQVGVTHIIIGCVHLHPGNPQLLHLNDHPPGHPRFETLWKEVSMLRKRGIKFLCMLGGAAPGCFGKATLDAADLSTFQLYYKPLRDMIRRFGFDGIDLDVEEPMSQSGIERLVDTLRSDFGPDWTIVLTPVATAMLGLHQLSGFDYFELEEKKGPSISWYNLQFYNNWGDLTLLEQVLQLWSPKKVVAGLLTSPNNGSTVPPSFEIVTDIIHSVNNNCGGIGGIMGWEYFNSLPGGENEPWKWAEKMSRILGIRRNEDAANIDDQEGVDSGEAAVPHTFEYDSDTIEPDS